LPDDNPMPEAAVPKDATRQRKRVLLLANPKASTYADVGGRARRHLEMLADVTTVDLTALDDVLDAEAPIERFCEDADMVFVAGGDGTINGLLDCLIAWQRPVGIIPAGTANDLAHSWELPTDPEAVVEAQFAGEPEMISVGLVNGHAFVNVASVGLGASVARQMDSGEKSILGPLSYAMAMLRAWRAAQRIAVSLEIDGKRIDRRIIQLGVANGRYHGGFIAASETASLLNPEFDIYCVKATAFAEVVKAFLALLMAAHGRTPSVETFKGRKVEIRTNRPLDINVDGELVTQTPAIIVLSDTPLRLLRPAGRRGRQVAAARRGEAAGHAIP
jgi:diacylglycerol kinase (ATP)